MGSLVVAGATSGATQLLIARGLHAGGVSAGAIGLVFSACAAGYISVSAGFVRLGARGYTLRVNAIVTLLASTALLPALAGDAPGVLVAALLLTAAPRGAINVVAYGVAGRPGQGGGGSVYGLLNGAWAAATVSAPLAAGALVGHAGPGAAYLVVIVPCLAISVALLLSAARERDGDKAPVARSPARRRG